MRKNLLTTFFAICCFSFGFSQADCANALALTPGSPQAGDSTGQAGEFPAIANPCDANYNDDEYWFEYTATEDGEVLDLSVTDITQTWAGVFVLEGDCAGPFTCVASAENGGSTADLAVMTPGLTNGTSYKIVIANWGTPNNTAFTMNATVIPAPSCPVPTAAMVGNVGTDSADFSWSAGGSETAWDIELVDITAAGTATGTPTSTGVTNPYTQMGLTPNNSYEYYVRADCGAGGTSDWVGPIAFTTQCTPFTAPFTEDFENGGSIPDCWSMSGGEDWLFNTSGPNHVGDGGTITGSTASNGYYAVVDASGDDGPTVLLSPLVDVSGLTTPALTFFEISDAEDSANSQLDVEVYDGAAWNSVAVFNTNTSGWELKIIDLSGLTFTGDAQVRFTFSEPMPGDFDDDIAIDDVRLRELPTCLEPTALDATNIMPTTVDLSWMENGSATVWDIELVDVTAMGMATGTPTFTGVSNPTNITGLTADNDYEFYVRADCGGSDYSEWSGPYAFTTAPTCPTPTALDATNITGSAADLSWTAGGTETLWNIELVDVTAMGMATGTPTFTGVSNPTALSGLTGDNDYEYYVQADCGGGDLSPWAGPFAFTTAPANDDFADAIAVTCGGNYTGSTVNATLDEDDAPDNSSADLDAPNVWFSYTGSGLAEDVTLDLCPSDYDSSVLVYTGTSGNLTLVAANDDGTTANCTIGTRSFLTFQSDGTTTYYITIEGWNSGNTGNYDMTVTCVAQAPPPANDECANAEALTLAMTTSGTTVGATVDIADDNPSCESDFATIVDVWYSVDITGGTSDLNIITTITGTSDQANVAVYSDCSLTTELGCSDANGGETLTVNNLDNGTYIIRVWGDGVAARTEGTFDIVADATLSTNNFDNEAAFTYYPNPVENTLSLRAQNNIEAITMYNMLGQEVLSAKPNNVNSDVDMSSLANGAYFVKVTVANTTKTIRVIKQ